MGGLLLTVRVELMLCLKQKINILRQITELRARRRGSGSKVCTPLGPLPCSHHFRHTTRCFQRLHVEIRPLPSRVVMITMMMLAIIIKKITFITIYRVPGTVPSTSHELVPLILTAAL